MRQDQVGHGAIAFAATVGKGANPTGLLVVAPDGDLHGSNYSEVTIGTGTLILLTPSGAFIDLHDLDPVEGHPGRLVVGTNDALYYASVYLGFHDLGPPFSSCPRCSDWRLMERSLAVIADPPTWNRFYRVVQA